MPPTMIDGPWRAPSSPPDTPMPMKVRPESVSSEKRRIVSRKLALPASMTMSLADSTPRSSCDLLVDRLAGQHHDDDRARRPDRSGEFLQAVAGHHHVLQRAGVFDEGVGARRGAVEDGDAVPVLGDVERQVGAHRAKADQADFGFFHRFFPAFGFC